MKRLLCLLTALCLLFCLAACGSTESTGEASPTAAPEDTTPAKNLGERVETDILDVLLVNAEFTIKLNSSGTYSSSGGSHLNDEYFTAEEYDPAEDAGLAYIAPKGHTYVAIEFKAKNLDRASVSFGERMFAVEYNGETYKDLRTVYGCAKVDTDRYWSEYKYSNILMMAGEEKSYRCYVDIPVDVADLGDDFNLYVSLPNSKKETETFKFFASAETAVEVETTFAEAAATFLTEKGQAYFKKHLAEYKGLSGSEIKKLLKSKRNWNIEMKVSYGSWSGKFGFESDQRIKETLSDGNSGYFNERTWKAKGDTLIIDDEYTCTVCKLEDGYYLLIADNAPFALMH